MASFNPPTHSIPFDGPSALLASLPPLRSAKFFGGHIGERTARIGNPAREAMLVQLKRDALALLFGSQKEGFTQVVRNRAVMIAGMDVRQEQAGGLLR